MRTVGVLLYVLFHLFSPRLAAFFLFLAHCCGLWKATRAGAGCGTVYVVDPDDGSPLFTVAIAKARDAWTLQQVIRASSKGQ